jgi:hypothetical protein
MKFYFLNLIIYNTTIDIFTSTQSMELYCFETSPCSSSLLYPHFSASHWPSASTEPHLHEIKFVDGRFSPQFSLSRPLLLLILLEI